VSVCLAFALPQQVQFVFFSGDLMNLFLRSAGVAATCVRTATVSALSSFLVFEFWPWFTFKTQACAVIPRNCFLSVLIGMPLARDKVESYFSYMLSSPCV